MQSIYKAAAASEPMSVTQLLQEVAWLCCGNGRHGPVKACARLAWVRSSHTSEKKRNTHWLYIWWPMKQNHQAVNMQNCLQ